MVSAVCSVAIYLSILFVGLQLIYLPVTVDVSVSKVSIPHAVAGSKEPEIIEQVVETVCYSRLAEDFMVNAYKESNNFLYFGGHDGLFRQVPALHQFECGCYDPRRRPWYVAASSGPKDVVIVIDVSGSMDVPPGESFRLTMAKEAAITIVDTLTVADRFTVIAFSGDAYVLLGGHSTLLPATNENKNNVTLLIATSENKMNAKAAINEVEARGTTNFFAAFETAFNTIDNTLELEKTTEGRIAILFMTDGKILESAKTPEDAELETERVIMLVTDRTEKLAKRPIPRKTTIFTYSLGEASDRNVTKTIACSTGGIWTFVDDCGDLVGEMSSYYKLFALGNGQEGNEDVVSWVETYKFFSRGVYGTTVSMPVYDTSVTPHILLGGELNDV